MHDDERFPLGRLGGRDVHLARRVTNDEDQKGVGNDGDEGDEHKDAAPRANIDGSAAHWAARKVHAFDCIEPKFEQIVKKGGHRGPRERCGAHRHETKL